MRTHDDFMSDLDRNGHVDDDYNELAGRKKSRVVHPSLRVCHDWMVVSGNCHYARDATWFSEYRPVQAMLQHNIFNPQDEMQVAGVGTVHLTVRRRRTDNEGQEQEDNNQAVLVLEGVLHIPEAVCNGFNPLLAGTSMSCNRDYWEGADRTGQPMWYSLPFAGGTRLVLAKEPEGGESDLIEGRHYTLSLYVSPEEQRVILEGSAG